MRKITLLLLSLISGIASSQEVVISQEPAISQDPAISQEPTIILDYENHRQAFLEGKQAEYQRYQEKKRVVSYSQTFLDKEKETQAEAERLKQFEQRLDARIQEQEDERARLQVIVDDAQSLVDAEQDKIRAEQNRVAQARNFLNGFTLLRDGALASLNPILAIGAKTISLAPKLPSLPAVQIIAILFFSIWAINLFITLWKKDRVFMHRNRWIMGILLVLFLGLISAPLFAKNVVEEEAFLSQLELVDRILGQSEYQRFIEILEQKPQKEINLHEMDIQGAHLKPFLHVIVDTGEYYFTLGALYEHEGRMGDAVNAIRKIKGSSIQSVNQNAVLTASIKFLIDHHQMDAASVLLADSLDKVTNVTLLVDLAIFLDNKGMQASSDDVLNRAISVAKHYEDLIRLAQVFHENGSRDKASDALDRAASSTSNTADLVELSKLAAEMNYPDKSSTALERALEKTVTPEDLMLVAQTAIAGRQDRIIDRINEKADVLLDVDVRMQLIDLYRKNKHMEDAVEVFEALLKTVRKQDVEKQSKLMRYADLAIERVMYEQARNAIERLARLVGLKRNEISVKPNQKLSTLEGVPEQESLELQLYYGLLNEVMDFDDKAEDTYINSVKRSLKSILDSYGYDTPDNINNFYLLGRIWKELGELNKLEVIDRVYTDIENEILIKIRMGYEKELLKLQGNKDQEGYVEMNKEIERLEEFESDLKKRERNDQSDMQRSIDTLTDKLAMLKKELPEKKIKLAEYQVHVKQEIKEIVLKTVHLAATTLFLLSVFIGTLLWAYHKHAKHLGSSKTFGFLAKYIETSGWVNMLSIIGVLSGLIYVVFGQLMQIFQRNNEELRVLRQLAISSTNSPVAIKTSAPQAAEQQNSE